MLDPDLLKVLCCPETRQPLTLAEAPLVESVNQRIASGQTRSRSGELVTQKLDGGLLRHDGALLYPIRGSLPILLIDEAIPMEPRSA